MASLASVETYMLLIFGVVALSLAVVIILRIRVPDRMNGRALGWMSDQWLLERRASHQD